MKRLFVLLFIIFGFCVVSSSNANAAYCIKKKDDGKWPFYLGSTYDSKCPRKFKKVSKYEYEKFKKVIDEKYVPKGIVSTSPKKATNIKSSWNGTYIWRGQKVSKDVYCTNADKNKMRVYHPEEFELKCSDYGKLTFREIKKKEAEENKIKTQSSNEWITKKNNKFDKITEIENMYSEGFLSKSECEKAKSKILNTNEKAITSCDNIKVYTAKKKSDETKPTICAGINNYRFIYKKREIETCDENSAFYVITKDHSMYEWYASRILKTSDKKIEVAKVEEPKQEEFKPETKDIDNDAPIIDIAENIIVDSQTYTLKGKVKDKSRFFLTIDDRPIKVAKNGQFEFEGFAIDPKEQLKIVAIDRWKNKSEKVINIEVKIKEVADLRLYEKPNPGKIKVSKDNNKIGIIIGIEKYQNLDNIDAPYANRDANAFKAYANLALGIPNKNLRVLIDDKATRGELLKSLKIWLPQITRGQKKDIYIFFAGHGLASDNGEDLHILPHNGDPVLLEDTAISRVEMFDLINKVNPKSVTMFFDTCYSGQTRSEQMLVAGLRPVRIIADEQDTPNNYTIFTASNYDQTSGSISEAEHGIFSYYLMKGLEGNADENKDKKITNGELIAYLKNNVSQEAFSQNRSQEPMLSGDPNNILISYR